MSAFTLFICGYHIYALAKRTLKAKPNTFTEIKTKIVLICKCVHSLCSFAGITFTL